MIAQDHQTSRFDFDFAGTSIAAVGKKSAGAEKVPPSLSPGGSVDTLLSAVPPPGAVQRRSELETRTGRYTL
eukprot:COSAG02_NODE_65_length_42645_cov_26.951934_19_plen_72_part_00